MTTYVDIVNRALQTIGTRTTVTQAELDGNLTNEAIQANLILENYRDDLLRMAPWNCGTNTANLVLITAAPGTPENTSPATALWEKGQPSPPWVYEYQYPVDCLKPLFVVPQFQTGFSGGVPITTAVTGGAAAFWQGPPIKYKVAIDQFRPVTDADVVDGGTDYAIGDEITLPIGPIDEAPIGAPVKLRVATVAAGVILTVDVVNQVAGSDDPIGGSYFAVQTNPIAQDTTTGSGTGATFNLTFGASSSQRVILTNQENATLTYVQQVTDPNVMDTLFQSAWISLLGAGLALALTGDKALANLRIADANNDIMEARKADGNEGLTINDVTPDFIRIRGITYPGGNLWTGNQGFDWGPLWAAW